MNYFMGDSKWLNALQFYERTKSKNFGCRNLKASEFPLSPFWAFATLQLFSHLDRIYFNDFKPLYILDFYVMNDICIAVDYIGCKMQLASPNARTTLNEKKKT